MGYDEKDLELIKQMIPPQDIYAFAYRMFLASEFYLWKWSQWVDLIEEIEKCKISKELVNGTCLLRMFLIRPDDDN